MGIFKDVVYPLIGIFAFTGWLIYKSDDYTSMYPRNDVSQHELTIPEPVHEHPFREGNAEEKTILEEPPKTDLEFLYETVKEDTYNQGWTTSDPRLKNLEKAIRRLDPWAEHYLKKDCMDDDKKKYGLRVIKVDDSEKWYEFKTGGGHYPISNIIGIVEHEDFDSDSFSDIITHELWHSLYDDFGEESIFNHPGYSGPSHDEFVEYCLNSVSGKDFDSAREEIDHKKIATKKKIYDKHLCNDYVQDFQQDVSEINQKIEDNGWMFSYLRNDEKKFIESDLEKANHVLDTHSFSECNEKVEELLASDNSSVIDKLEEYRSEFKGNLEIKYYLSELRDVLYLAKNIAKFRKDFQNSVNQPEKAKIYLLKSCEEEFLKKKEILESSPIEYRFKRDIFEERISTHMKRYDEILNDPDEIMARKIESLYGLYYGKAEMNQVPLNEKEYEFLGRFNLNDIPMFRKGIEKSRLRDEMVKDGIPPEKATEMLEHATSFEYEGKVYSWPETEFRIVGGIPVLTKWDTIRDLFERDFKKEE